MSITTINHFDMSGINEFCGKVVEGFKWAGREISTFFNNSVVPTVSKVWKDTLQPVFDKCYEAGSQYASQAYSKLESTPYALNASVGVAGIGLYAVGREANSWKGTVVKTAGAALVIVSAARLIKEATGQ